MSSFHVDSRINLKLEYELAIRLGEMILQAGTDDKQILALGHKLANMDEEKQEFVAAPKWQDKPVRQHAQFSGWSKFGHEEEQAPERFERPVAEQNVPVTTMQDNVKQKVPTATLQDKIRSKKIRWGVN